MFDEFEAFAAHPFYTAINRSLVQQALAPLATRPPDATLMIVDMACGTGLITRLITEELALRGRQARIIALDLSADALRHAQKSIEEMGAQADFFKGEAVDLPMLVHDADAAFFCNAIHLITDKRSTFRQMAAILAPGGIFACNSAFYTGTNVESTATDYRLVSRARRGGLLPLARPLPPRHPHGCWHCLRPRRSFRSDACLRGPVIISRSPVAA